MDSKDKTKHFIGKICSGLDNNVDFKITFLGQSGKIKNGFVFPYNEDMASICKKDISRKLSVPKPVAQKTRLTGALDFSEDLSAI